MLKDLTIYFLSWNVAGQPLSEDLHAALGLPQPPNSVICDELPDVYAIGLQEVSVKPQNVIYDLLFNDPWIGAVKTILTKWNYVKVRHIRLQGIVLLVYCKRHHIMHLRGCQTTYTRTGLGGVWGNKGGVSFRMNIYGSSLCIVNCHLAAHDEELPQRIMEYNSIMDKQHFVDPQTSNIISHDYVFWFGDLNFRLDDLDAEEIMQHINQKNYSKLLECDQLKKTMSKGEAFTEFTETIPVFPPTYKFFFNKNDYNFQSRRPAWTDRVLFRFTPNAYENVTLKLRQLHYHSHEQYSLSDHKPVSSSFRFKVFAELPGKLVQFHPLSNWHTQSDSVAWYQFHHQPDTPSLSDWIGLFKVNFDSVEEHLHYVWASSKPETDSPPVEHDQSRTDSCPSDHSAVTRPWYKVTFGDQCLLVPGWYRLLYVSGRFDDVLGMSEPFQIFGACVSQPPATDDTRQLQQNSNEVQSP